ncbi:hypothetical protein [[Pseudopropionibacterium] massiliense]|uniref:hypothetical protein n=1 Tax=[Pseudopropionibacterium] massiliense TaxID=2220000 RepID=UPI001FE48585|nr:hypothetical protein [[Pseudopropionibacterium] massiliense]
MVATCVLVRRASSVGVRGPSWLSASSTAKSPSLSPSTSPTTRLLAANAPFSLRSARIIRLAD